MAAVTSSDVRRTLSQATGFNPFRHVNRNPLLESIHNLIESSIFGCLIDSDSVDPDMHAYMRPLKNRCIESVVPLTIALGVAIIGSAVLASPLLTISASAFACGAALRSGRCLTEFDQCKKTHYETRRADIAEDYHRFFLAHQAEIRALSMEDTFDCLKRINKSLSHTVVLDESRALILKDFFPFARDSEDPIRLLFPNGLESVYYELEELFDSRRAVILSSTDPEQENLREELQSVDSLSQYSARIRFGRDYLCAPRSLEIPDPLRSIEQLEVLSVALELINSIYNGLAIKDPQIVDVLPFDTYCLGSSLMLRSLMDRDPNISPVNELWTRADKASRSLFIAADRGQVVPPPPFIGMLTDEEQDHWRRTIERHRRYL